MSSESAVFTRKELYDLVWSTSLVALSKKYMLSDNGLRKICIRMSIPLPQAGHWVKLQHGKRVDKFPLPAKYDGDDTVHLPIRDETDYEKEVNPLKKTVQQLKSDPQLTFEVPERLSSKDPLILAAKERLTGKDTRTSYRYKGVVSCGWEELDIRVAPANASRALRFMDTLIQLLRARGHSITIKDNSTYAVVKGHDIKILFREKLKKVVVKDGSWNSTEYHPTGILSFRQDGYQGKEWKDGTQQLESHLPGIIARMELTADFWVEWALQREKERELREEKARIEQGRQERKAKELAELKKLLEKAERWHKTENLRRYITEVENSGIANKEWLDWARKKADWYDPFMEADDELLIEIDRKTLDESGSS